MHHVLAVCIHCNNAGQNLHQNVRNSCRAFIVKRKGKYFGDGKVRALSDELHSRNLALESSFGSVTLWELRIVDMDPYYPTIPVGELKRTNDVVEATSDSA